MKSKQEAHFLVDETQNHVHASIFTLLLENMTNGNITTIGARVPDFQAVFLSSFGFKFTVNYNTDHPYSSKVMRESRKKAFWSILRRMA